MIHHYLEWYCFHALQHVRIYGADWLMDCLINSSGVGLLAGYLAYRWTLRNPFGGWGP